MVLGPHSCSVKTDGEKVFVFIHFHQVRRLIKKLRVLLRGLNSLTTLDSR